MNPAELTKLDFFYGISGSELELIAPFILQQKFSACQLIFKQDTVAEYLYLLCEGIDEIVFKPDDGPSMRVTTINPGGVFGWSAAMGNVLYTSAAECKTDCTILKIRGTDLKTITRKYPELGSLILDKLAAVIAQRWETRQNKINALLRQKVFQPKVKEKCSLKETLTVKNNESSEKFEQMKGLVEQLSAYIEHFHGGSVEFISFDGKNLKVQLGGACLGCPLSPATLHGWVEGTVRQFFPDIEKVEAI